MKYDLETAEFLKELNALRFELSKRRLRLYKLADKLELYDCEGAQYQSEFDRIQLLVSMIEDFETEIGGIEC